MLRNRHRSASGDDVVRRPLVERDVNAEKQGVRAPPLKAKQSPAVNRQRDPGLELGSSSSSSARSMGVLKIPTRLATAQVQRIEHLKLPSKRPDLSHDATAESPFKRIKRSQPDISDEHASQDAHSFVPVSLSLGGMAAPVVSGAAIFARGGPLRAPPRVVQQADAGERKTHVEGNSNFMAELKAKLRQREERKAGMSDMMGIGMKDIRDVFLNFLHTFKNFTSEILREEDDDSDEWEWAEHSASPGLNKNSGAGGVVMTPPGGTKAAWNKGADPWDDDPWSDHKEQKSSIGARVGAGRMESSRMRGPCTPSSLLLEKRLGSPPGSRGKLANITGKISNLRKGRLCNGSPQGFGDFMGRGDGESGRGGIGRRVQPLRHSPGGGSSSPMLNSVYNALEERLMISPGRGSAALGESLQTLSKQQGVSARESDASITTASNTLFPRKASDAPKLFWNIQQVREDGSIRSVTCLLTPYLRATRQGETDGTLRLKSATEVPGQAAQDGGRACCLW